MLYHWQTKFYKPKTLYSQFNVCYFFFVKMSIFCAHLFSKKLEIPYLNFCDLPCPHHKNPLRIYRLPQQKYESSVSIQDSVQICFFSASQSSLPRLRNFCQPWFSLRKVFIARAVSQCRSLRLGLTATAGQACFTCQWCIHPSKKSALEATEHQ